MVEIEGYLFKIMAADNRRIMQLQVTIPEIQTTPVETEE
jgi:magnesium and cobalt transporter